MDDQLDNDLKNRIREVFDNYEEPSADEGWLLLRERFPEEQSGSRVFGWAWWGAAALILMFLGAGLWLYNLQAPVQKYSYKPLKQIKAQNQVAVENRHDTVKKINAVHKNYLAQTQAGNQLDAVQPVISKEQVNTASAKPANSITPIGLLKDTSAKQNLIAGNLKGNDKKNSADSSKITSNVPVTTQLAATEPPKPANAVQSVVKQQPKTIYDLFAADKKANTAKNSEKSEDDEKRVRFGLYATTYFNYAKGSSNQVNAGAGFSSDIKISKNLKLVTGLAVGQNTLTYAGNTPPAAAQQGVAMAAAKAFAASSVIPKAFSDIAAPTIKNYNANLVGLDIPINLKYELNPDKNDIYISAGLSSGTFINESYTSQYNYPSFIPTDPQQTKNETTNNSFNSFYFAKTLNFAFGMGLPFGKNKVVIEPFLKYPLDGLGSQQLKFGAGGLNLKFNFQNKKK